MWAEGFKSPNVNMNLSSCGNLMWSWVHVGLKTLGRRKRLVGSRERDQSNLTFRNLKPLFDGKGSVLCGY
jgi:hypothetical protein